MAFKKYCKITRIYVTPRGRRGVSYTLNGRRGATLLPDHIRGIEAVRAYLKRSLGVIVDDATDMLSGLSPRALGELASGGARTGTQARTLAFGRSRLRALVITGDVVEATVAPSGGQGARYTTTLNTRTREHTCTCPHGTYNAHRGPCAHVTGLARLLLAHPDLTVARQRDRLIRVDAIGQGLIARRARVVEAVLGCLRLVGDGGTSVWVPSSQVVFVPEEGTGAAIGVFGALPGHALSGLEDLTEVAPRARMAA